MSAVERRQSAHGPGSRRSLVPEGCDEREYARLLGYPWGRPLEGDVRARAIQAAEWYRTHARPRVHARELEATQARELPAHVAQPVGAAPSGTSVTVAVISAGPEVEREVDRLWAADRVDEAYFLDRYAAAVVERLARELGPYRSPGCGEVPFEQQRSLFEHVASLAEDIEMLPSGMLKPRHSLLALVPRDAGGGGNPCHRCELEGCSFRRGATPRREAT